MEQPPDGEIIFQMSISEKDRWVIVNSWLTTKEEDRDIAAIARKHGVMYRTAKRWIDSYQRTGGVADKHRSGRPRTSSSRQDSTLSRIVSSRPSNSVGQITQEWKKRSKIEVHPNTVRNRLKEFGYKNRIARLKVVLSQRNKQRRVVWATAHLNWSDFQCSSAMRLTSH